MATIKAGTYRFNDELTEMDFSQDIEGIIDIDGRLIHFSHLHGVYLDLYIDAEIEEGVASMIYCEGWIYSVKTLTITENSEVSEDFYNWFVENANPIIKKGTYRFNDVLTVPNADISQDILYSISHSCSSSLSAFANFIGNTIFITPSNWSGNMVVSYIEDDMGGTFPAYSTGSYGEYDFTGWNGLAVDVSAELEGWGQTITVTEDTEVSTEFYAWFMANTIVTLKAGTYRFNDVLTNIDATWQDISFTAKYKGAEIPCEEIFVEIIGGEFADLDMLTFDFVEKIENIGGVSVFSGGLWINDDAKIITIPNDSEVSAEFSEWFKANSKPVTTTITYNGSTIASLSAGQTVTLKCAGKKMETDVVVETGELVIPDWYVLPSGNLPITKNGNFEVGQYESVTVNVPSVPIEIANAVDMNDLLTTAEAGSVYKYTGETTDTYEHGALYIVEEVTE